MCRKFEDTVSFSTFLSDDRSLDCNGDSIDLNCSLKDLDTAFSLPQQDMQAIRVSP